MREKNIYLAPNFTPSHYGGGAGGEGLNLNAMTNETKKQLLKFLWKFLTALIAALGGVASASAAHVAGLI